MANKLPVFFNKRDYKLIDKVYLHAGSEKEQKIVRYINIAKTLDILNSKKLFIPRRDKFTDRREKGEFYELKNHFPLETVGGVIKWRMIELEK